MSALDRETLGLVRVLRGVLIEHIDGRRVPFAAPSRVPRLSRARAVRLLLNHDMLALEDGMTSITDKGRFALAEMLADWADALALASASEFCQFSTSHDIADSAR